MNKAENLATVDFDRVRSAVYRALSTSAEILREQFISKRYSWNSKEDGSLLSTTDLDVDKTITDILSEAFPIWSIESEESAMRVDSGPSMGWIVDPLDGTDNFIQGSGYFSSAIGLTHEGKVIAAGISRPVTDEYIYIDVSVRQSHGGAVSGVERPSERLGRIGLCSAYGAREEAFVVDVAQNLLQISHRVMENWCPSLDWWSLLTDRLDALVSVARPSDMAGLDSKIGRFVFSAMQPSRSVQEFNVLDLSEQPIGRLEVASRTAEVSDVIISRLERSRALFVLEPTGNSRVER
jgi:fructose-1,6-bisphosphatase/inositol monophosphatase family enzyme